MTEREFKILKLGIAIGVATALGAVLLAFTITN